MADQGRQVQAEAVVQQAGREQQGFAGQHGEKHARFDEDDEHRSRQDPRSHCDKQRLRVLKPLDNGAAASTDPMRPRM